MRPQQGDVRDLGECWDKPSAVSEIGHVVVKPHDASTLGNLRRGALARYALPGEPTSSPAMEVVAVGVTVVQLKPIGRARLWWRRLWGLPL